MRDKPVLKAKHGDLVQLQYAPPLVDAERLNARLIGYVTGKSLILSAPTVSGTTPFLQEKQKFIVRMMCGSQVYAFESEILKYLTSPYTHVHLSYPQSIETMQVRNAQRVNTEITVSVQLSESGDSMPATMLNTSLTGALIKTDKINAKKGDTLIISAEFPFYEFKKYLRLTAVIRNVTTVAENQSFRYGVEFLDIDDDQKLILHGYVYDQLVTQLEKSS
ncbi:MAG: flagellar brake protein [Gammaproteobacteria bacterium]|nr:flagellar brake protein [Gammaproteobacteria bacterium]